ncbi:MAG: hypothetical protein MRK02_00925 [Candidatus Scalindua sp.]|nr:hypothetical protein [Candidatus Scalindua sp.]
MSRTVITIAEIIQDIDNHIHKCGGVYSRWYIGIASDPRDRLFNDHKVEKNNDAWIIRDCGSEEAVRRVEKYFLDRGCDGGTGGGDSATTYAYAYKKNAHTRS